MANTHQSNKLAGSSSPYLLQHQNNPVLWYPWGKEALDLAKAENKPLIVSIGYSACHWCHVMEHESFESEEVAAIMNRHFVCIKIDREERPDIDQIYMDAVQLMGINGGWPLNVFCLPDGRPFYGGTYFPKEKWIYLLTEIARAYREHNDELVKSAVAFQQGINESEVKKYKLDLNVEAEFKPEQIITWREKMVISFDQEDGGFNRAPKFPMPSIWRFLLQSLNFQQDDKIEKHLKLTLNKMALGGLYDQVEGGFTRYSTDMQWFAPHFEKMLYDNGQLLSLYAEAAIAYKDEFYKSIVKETADYILSDFLSPKGAFYAAYDADSEGVEGKYYCFSQNEMRSLPYPELFIEYFNATEHGNWEEKNILFADSRLSTELLAKHNLGNKNPQEVLYEFKTAAKAIRKQKVRPGLDYKILTGWNALCITGLLKASLCTGEAKYQEAAEDAITYIMSNLWVSGRLKRCQQDEANFIDATLEDYALLIESLICAYEVCNKPEYLLWANELASITDQLFFDANEGFYFYTSSEAEQLIARKKELWDNVIPASNSVMATNNFKLSLFFADAEKLVKAKTQVSAMLKLLSVEIRYVSNWASLYLAMSAEFFEVVFSGPNAAKMKHQLISEHYLPNVLVSVVDEEDSAISLNQFRYHEDKDLIYVCRGNSCLAPVETLAEALALIKV